MKAYDKNLLILQSAVVIFDPAFSTYKLVLHLMTWWALLDYSYLLHYFPAVLCTNDGWFMLLFLSYYFVGSALCNKATPSPQGSTYCAEAAFLAYSDTSCPFLHILFIFHFCAWNFFAVNTFAFLTYPIRTLATNTNAVYGTSTFTF